MKGTHSYVETFVRRGVDGKMPTLSKERNATRCDPKQKIVKM